MVSARFDSEQHPQRWPTTTRILVLNRMKQEVLLKNQGRGRQIVFVVFDGSRCQWDEPWICNMLLSTAVSLCVMILKGNCVKQKPTTWNLKNELFCKWLLVIQVHGYWFGLLILFWWFLFCYKIRTTTRHFVAFYCFHGSYLFKVSSIFSCSWPPKCEARERCQCDEEEEHMATTTILIKKTSSSIIWHGAKHFTRLTWIEVVFSRIGAWEITIVWR